MSDVLRVSDITAGYGGRRVLSGVSLCVTPAERMLVVGPNGSGKSTLLKVIVGLVKQSKGEVFFHGENLLHLSPENRVVRGMGYLAQTRNIFASLTVYDNLHLSACHITEQEFHDRQEWVLGVFPLLRDKLSRRAGLLSGGERQALAIGMVLLKKSSLFLFDEPTAGLAPKAALDILAGLRTAHQQTGFACLIVTHNIRHVQDWVDRAVVMVQGRIAEQVSDVGKLRGKEFLERHYF
jgi:branched-chain amino acid transport system ATP-binding protein